MPKKVSPMVIEVHNSDKGNIHADGASALTAATTPNRIDSSYVITIADDCVVSIKGSRPLSNAISSISFSSSINKHPKIKSSNASSVNSSTIASSAASVVTSDSNDKSDSNHFPSESSIHKSNGEITNGSNIKSTATAAINIDESAEKAVEFWESSNQGIKLNSTLKEIAIEAYKIHYIKNRGITMEDVAQKKTKWSVSYVKRMLYECQKIKLLVPLEGHKQGRFNEYFLTTEIGKFLEKQEQQKRKGSQQSLNSNELSVIQILINEITGRKPTFHKFLIHFNTLPLDEKFEFDEVYQSLLTKDNWIEKSKNNKAKVKCFRLEDKRSCTIQVYPKGIVIVMVECSYRPFKLHDEEGSQEFWKSIGKIELLLGQEFGQTAILPPSGQWLLKAYDRDVTIPESDLVKKYPSITHWYSKEGIQLRALGRVFQIYGKIMPICGKCLRIEERASFKEDIPLEQGIKEIVAVGRPLEIVNAFEMLKNKREVDAKDM